MRYLIALAALAALVTLGVWNSPKADNVLWIQGAHGDTHYRILPDGTTLRELKPGEVPMPGWTPVNSKFGDWYDGTNWARINGTTMTTTLVCRVLVNNAIYTTDESISGEVK